MKIYHVIPKFMLDVVQPREASIFLRANSVALSSVKFYSITSDCSWRQTDNAERNRLYGEFELDGYDEKKNHWTNKGGIMPD